MKDYSCVVSVVQGSGLIAGLQWQPLLSKAWLKRNLEVRTTAQLLDCERWVAYAVGNSHVAGFEDCNPGNELEDRPRKQFSLACCLARAYGAQDTMVVWRIRHGERAGEVALVILEGGLITLDVVRSEKQAFSIMEYYQRLRETDTPFYIVSNDPSVWIADTVIESEESFLEKNLKRSDVLQSVPANYSLLLKLLVLALFLTVGWFAYAHWEKKTRIEQAELALAEQDQSKPYVKALEQSREQIGLTSEQVQNLLEEFYSMPVVTAGWALQRIRCEIGACVFTWRSVGGYTHELTASYEQDRDMVFDKVMKSDGVLVAKKSFSMPALYPANWRELPTLEKRSVWLEQEKQMWRRTQLNVTMAAEAKMWPPGFERAIQGDFVHRFTFEVNGDLILVEDFIRTYNEHVFWSELDMSISPGGAGKLLGLNGRGAFYAVR